MAAMICSTFSAGVATVRPATAIRSRRYDTTPLPKSTCGPAFRIVTSKPVGAPSRGKGRMLSIPPVAAARSTEVFGMDTSEGLFGFSPFAELWVGRLAMMGFLTSIVEEAITGQGTLAQIGLEPSPALLGLMLAIFGGATVTASAVTLRQAQDGTLPPQQMDRFRALLGLKDETTAIAATEAALKGSSDPLRIAMTTDETAINEARTGGTAADDFLTFNQEAADTAAENLKASSKAQGPTVSLAARQDIIEQSEFIAASAELEYAKAVEIRNGRWAMIGFLAAIVVEAGTGHGIIMQLIDGAKLVGLLGAESGF